MNNDEQANTFCPLYVGESTGFHRHMISAVVFYYSETLEIMLVEKKYLSEGTQVDQNTLI